MSVGTAIVPVPDKDRVIADAFRHLLEGTSWRVSWCPVHSDAEYREILAAPHYRDLPVISAIRFSWSLTPACRRSTATVLVPGGTNFEDIRLMLQHALGGTHVECATPCEGTLLELPVIIDKRLLTDDSSRGIYCGGLSRQGLFLLAPNQDTQGVSNRDLFTSLFVEYDTFVDKFCNSPVGSYPKLGQLALPIFEPLMAEILQLAEDAEAKTSLARWASLFNLRKPLSRSEVTGDVDYWRTRKESASDVQAAGDNVFLARMCESLVVDTELAHRSDEGVLQTFLSGMNLMLLVGAGTTSRMAFPLSLIVYERCFFPFMHFVSGQTGALSRHWGPFANLPPYTAAFLQRREMLKYCRVTQYTQADISFVGDPREGSRSQTGRALLQGKLFQSCDDNVARRRLGQAAGQEIDEELGIRSLFYLRLYPPGLDDVVHDGQGASIYLFGYSPFSQWFRIDNNPASIAADVWPLAKVLQERVGRHRATVQALAHAEVIDKQKTYYLFEDIRLKAEREADIDTHKLASKSDHSVWWRVRLNEFHPVRIDTNTLAEAFATSDTGVTITDLFNPKAFDELQECRNYSVDTDPDFITALLKALWANCKEHGVKETVHLAVEEYSSESAVALCFRNALPDGRSPSIAKYLLQRQRIPMARSKLPSGLPRGFCLFMTNLALESMGVFSNATGTSNVQRIWLEYGLRRSSVTNTTNSRQMSFPTRPVRLVTEWDLESVQHRELFSEWEVKICLARAQSD